MTKLVIRESNTKRVKNVIFPNGLQVGLGQGDFDKPLVVKGRIATSGDCHIGGNLTVDGTTTATGAGLQGLTIILSPTAVTLAASAAGTVSSYSPAAATVTVYKGSTQLTIDASGPYSDDTFQVNRAAGSSITAGGITQVDGASSASIAAPSSMSADNATISVDVVVTEGSVSTTYTVIQTLSKAIAGDTSIDVSFTRSIIPVDTDDTGGAIDDGNDLSDADISEQAFTKIDANVGTTNVTFAGHNESGNPASNTYKIVSDDMTAVTDNGTALTEANSASEGDGVSGTYNVTFANSGTRLTLIVSTDSSDAKLKVSTLTEHEDGSNTDFNSIIVNVPIKVTTVAGTQTVTRAFTIQKVKKGANGTNGSDGADGSDGDDGDDGDDTYRIWASKGGKIVCGSVTSAGVVSHTSADYVFIQGLRANTVIAYNGQNDGAEGTTADRFALEIDTDEDIAGYSYATDGSARAIYSDWTSSYVELKDVSSGGDVLARLTPSTDGSGATAKAKLTLSNFATLCNSKVLQSIHIDIKVDAYVNGAVVDDYMVSMELSKQIPGAVGDDVYAVKLTADYTQVTYNSSGASPSPAGNITLTATTQNVANPFFKLTGGTGDLGSPNGGLSTAESTWRDGTDATHTTRLWDTPSSLGSAVTITVSVKDDGAGGAELATDTLTITSVQQGAAGTPAVTDFIQLTHTGGDVTIENPGGVSYTRTDFNIDDLGTAPVNIGSEFAHTDIVVTSDNTIDGADATDSTKDSVAVSNAGTKIYIQAQVTLKFGTPPSTYSPDGTALTPRPPAGIDGQLCIVHTAVPNHGDHGSTALDYGTEIGSTQWSVSYAQGGESFPSSGEYLTVHTSATHTVGDDDTYFWLRISNYSEINNFLSAGRVSINVPSWSYQDAKMTITRLE